MRIFILMFLVVIGMKATGETSAIPRVYEEGKVWTYLTHFPDEPEKDYYYEISVAGDSIVEEIVDDNIIVDVVATKIRYRNLNMENDDYFLVVYEKDGIIYDYFRDIKKFYPKMDFNVKKGDVRQVLSLEYIHYGIDSDYVMSLVVGKDERVSINGKDIRFITIEDEKEHFLGYWIEGVGMISDLGAACMIDYPLPTCCYSETRLIKCEKDGACIFSEEDLIKYSGVDAVYNDRRKDGIIYDLNGRQVKWPVKGQIYIRNGEKLIW